MQKFYLYMRVGCNILQAGSEVVVMLVLATIVVTTMFVAAAIVVILSGLCLIRNRGVYQYRMALLANVSRANLRDIDAGRPWRWRYDVFDSVSYNTMVWQFWRRFDSFYPDQSFRGSA